MKIFKFLILFLVAVFIFTACGGGGGDPEASASLDMSFKVGDDGWLDSDMWWDWSGPDWSEGAIVLTEGSPSGKPYIKIPAGREGDSWKTISRRIDVFLNTHGAGWYRFGCKARVDTAGQAHYGNLGYRIAEGWPTFSTLENWTVQVGTSWTEIKTDDQGIWIDGAAADSNALLTYKAATSTDITGGGWSYYAGELYLADWYLEFLGN